MAASSFLTGSSSIQCRIWRMAGSATAEADDHLAVEEPLEIRIVHGDGAGRQTKTAAVTMRTPGADEQLAAGFLFTEGIISGASDITGIGSPAAFCDRNAGNVIEVRLQPHLTPNITGLDRNFYMSSSCGVCGKASIDAVRLSVPQRRTDLPALTIAAADLLALPARLRQHQQLFESTGGLHASALFDAELNMLLLKEDVGRHNALDKAIGAALLGRIPLAGIAILLLSGRTSFELIQKAAMAGIGLVAAIGAPSSLALSMAEETGITLVGFLKEHQFNIYTHPQRIKCLSYEDQDQR